MKEKLNQYFHFRERGSCVSQEVKAGISVFLISVCALFLNIQIVAGAFADNIPYCGLYLGATITAFLGTLILGFFCNLPLVQTASLSLSSVMISTLGTGSGLTWENLLAVTFVAALVYLAVMVIPGVKGFLFHLIPKSVRNALPVAMGLYVAWTALTKMQLVDGNSLASLSADALGGAAVAPYVRLCILAGLTGFLLLAVLRKRNAETPALSALVAATLLFFLIAVVSGGIAFTYVFTQNRIWIGANPDPTGEMYTIGLGMAELKIGSMFTKGFDFTAFTAAGGNVFRLFFQGILTFLFMGMYESEAAVLGADCDEEILDEEAYEKESGKFLTANAVTNVIAPIVGAAPVSIGKQSAVAVMDGGKTGLTSVVCAIGYLISMFTWIPFVLLSTYTASVPEYGHAGFVFPNVIHALFQIADGVMLFAGLMMLKNCRKLSHAKMDEIIPFAVTVAAGVFTQNIAYGVAAGAAVHVLLALVSFDKKEVNGIGVPKAVMAVLSVILLIMAAAMPALTGTAAKGTGAEVSGTAAAAQTDGPSDFTFDQSTGEFSFAGIENADYYCVWIYEVADDGTEASSYVSASQRLTGSAAVSGTVDVSSLAYGTYHVKLLTFWESGTAPEPVVETFTVSGGLSTPEFMAAAEGTAVTVTLYSDTLATYNEKEKFTDLTIRVYDESGNEVSADQITADDLVVSAWGPNKSYSADKVLTLQEGNWLISVQADGDGSSAQASAESEKVPLTVAAGSTATGMTSGYVVSEEGGGAAVPAAQETETAEEASLPEGTETAEETSQP